jgi:hypothetical protein
MIYPQHKKLYDHERTKGDRNLRTDLVTMGDTVILSVNEHVIGTPLGFC